MRYTDITVRVRYPWSGQDFGGFVRRLDQLIQDELEEYEDWSITVGPEIEEEPRW